MINKWIIAFGLLSLLVLAGCPKGDDGSNNDNRGAVKMDQPGGGDSGSGDSGGGDSGGGE